MLETRKGVSFNHEGNHRDADAAIGLRLCISESSQGMPVLLHRPQFEEQGCKDLWVRPLLAQPSSWWVCSEA